jgi:hypothetical protein
MTRRRKLTRRRRAALTAVVRDRLLERWRDAFTIPVRDCHHLEGGRLQPIFWLTAAPEYAHCASCADTVLRDLARQPHTTCDSCGASRPWSDLTDVRVTEGLIIIIGFICARGCQPVGGDAA